MRRNTRKNYNNARTELEAIINSQNLTDEQKARVRDVGSYLESVRNYTNANPVNNASQRDYETEAYKIAKNYIETGTTPVPGAITGTSNIFKGVNHREVLSDTGAIFDKWFNQENPTQQNITMPESNSPFVNNNVYFKYNAGLNINNLNPKNTFAERAKSYISKISENIDNALTEKNKGKTIRGLNAQTVAKLPELKQQLAAIDVNGDPFNVVEQIGNIVNTFTSDASELKNYFGNLYPTLTPAEQNKAVTEKEYTFSDTLPEDFGENLKSYIEKNNYHVGQKDGNYYLISSDYKGPVTGKSSVYMNPDWTSNEEGYGYIIGDDGKIIYGDLNSYYNNPKSEYYKSLRDYINGLNIPDRLKVRDYNKNDFGVEIADLHRKNLAGRSVADMSGYFNTNVPIVATIEGDNWDKARSKYGYTKVDNPDIKYYWKDQHGNPKSGNYTDLTEALGNILDLNTNGELKGLTDWQDTKWWNNLYPDVDNINSLDANGETDWSNTWNSTKDIEKELEKINWWDNDVYSIQFHRDSIKSRKPLAKMLIQLWNEGRRGELPQNLEKMYVNWFGNHPKSALVLIRKALSDDPHLLEGNLNYEKVLRDMLIFYNQNESLSSIKQEEVPTEKTGGILTAKGGTKASKEVERVNKSMESASSRYDHLRSRAADNGRTIKQQQAVDAGFTWQDGVRMGALTADIAGLIAAIAGPATAGVGSAVAVGSGVVSTLADTLADFTDDSISAGEAWKNLGINAGLTAGAAFGARAGAIAKRAIKYVPKALAVLSTAGVALDPNTHRAVKHLSEGNMDAGDWKAVMQLLRTAVGLGTMGATKYKGKTGSEKFMSSYDKNIKNASTANSDPKFKLIKSEEGDIKMDKSVVTDFESKLAAGKRDEAIKVLTDAGVSQSAAESAVIETTKPKGWRFWKKRETILSTDLTPDLNGQQAAVLQEIDRISRSPYGRRSPAVYALLASEREKGRKFKNLDEMKTWWSDSDNFKTIDATTPSTTSAATVSPITTLTAADLRPAPGKPRIRVIDTNGNELIVSRSKGDIRLLDDSGHRVKLFTEDDFLTALNNGDFQIKPSINKSGGTINYTKMRNYVH